MAETTTGRPADVRRNYARYHFSKTPVAFDSREVSSHKMKAWAGMIPNGMPAQDFFSATTTMNTWFIANPRLANIAPAARRYHVPRRRFEHCAQLPPELRRAAVCTGSGTPASHPGNCAASSHAASLPVDVSLDASADGRFYGSFDVTKNHPSRRCAESAGAVFFDHNTWRF